MIFQVNRTSSEYEFWNIQDLETMEKTAKKNFPCEGAEVHIYMNKDKWDRTIYHCYYTINIDTLEELIDWRNKLDEEIIINPKLSNGIDGMNCIEIYDDFRE